MSKIICLHPYLWDWHLPTLGNPGSTTGYLSSRSNEHKTLINANRKTIDIDTGIHEN